MLFVLTGTSVPASLRLETICSSVSGEWLGGGSGRTNLLRIYICGEKKGICVQGEENERWREAEVGGGWVMLVLRDFVCVYVGG